MFPKGIILPYSGNLSALPSGWALCDGTNGNPDLRGRFLVGSGDFSDDYGYYFYSIGATAGERMHKMTITEMPSHSHSFSFPESDRGLVSGRPDPGAWRGGESGGIDSWQLHTQYNLPILSYTGDSQPHNNMPPYFVVHWIIKI